MHKKSVCIIIMAQLNTVPLGRLAGSLALGLSKGNNLDGIIVQLSIVLCLIDSIS